MPSGTERRGLPLFKGFRTAFKSNCPHDKLAGVPPHVLRHKFAVEVLFIGIDLRMVQELSYRKTQNMVRLYELFNQEGKRQAIELLAENSPTVFATAETENPASPCAPIAQVDRASAF